jgi:hypothetical protein
MPRHLSAALALLLALTACTPPTDPAEPANRPPTVSAGEDRTVSLPADDIPLNGAASDPDGDTLSATWSQSDGSEGVTFEDETGLRPPRPSPRSASTLSPSR